jgi:hypothetical protein
LFDKPIGSSDFGNPLSLGIMIAGMIATVAVCCGVMYWRYVPNE